MCKTPLTECQAVHTDNEEPMDEDVPETSEDESYMESDESYYSDTSLDIRGGLDSDADSASGNRVTPKMVLWLMLKEQGLITEEQYAEKAEICIDNIKSLIPPIPRCNSWDSIDCTDDLSDVENIDDKSENNSISDIDIDKEKIMVNLVKEHECDNKSSSEVTNGNQIKSHENVERVGKGILKDTEPIEKEQTDIDVQEDSTDRCMKDISEQTQGDNVMLQKQAGTDININKFNEEEVNNLQLGQASMKMNTDDSSQEQHKELVKCELMASSTNANRSNSDQGKYTISEGINKLSTLTDTVLESQKQVLKCNIAIIQMLNLLNENIAKYKDNIMDTFNIEAQTNSIEDGLITSNKKTRSFKYILQKLVKENRIKEAEEEQISEEGGQGFVKNLQSYVRRLDNEYKNNMVIDVSDQENETLKAFAMFLNFYSPSSYKYVTETYNTPLPDPKALCYWYLKDVGEPGFTKKAFKILKQKSAKKRQTCALMFCDIFLKNDGRYYDRVDYGGGCNYNCTNKAVLVYVFVLVSLDEDWKMPIGYIYARNIPAETQAELIRISLTLCHEAGADVVAVTLETPTPAEFLGCSFEDEKNLKTTFKHPECDREVAVWIDPCLALKSARQTLKFRGVLEDGEGHKVRWNLIRKMKNLLSDDEIDFKNPKFLKLRNHIAKFHLTIESFSRSLSHALELCEELLPNIFTDTAPTQRYIRVINKLYDILNASNIRYLGNIAIHLKLAKEYMINLFCDKQNVLSTLDRHNLAWGDKRVGYRHFVEGQSVCGFIGFLIGIESLKHLDATLVRKERRLKQLNLHRLCKVHAEDLVKNLRAYSHSEPEYFTGSDFQSFYKHLFGVLEKNPLFRDRELSLEHWPLQNRYPPAVTIKLTSGKRYFDDVYSSQYKLKKQSKTSNEKRATNLVRDYSRALDTERDLSTRKNMVGYLCGWIAAQFAKFLKCEVCVDSLCSDRKLWFHKFITLKDIKGVCLPGEEIFRICWECERAIRLKRSLAGVTAWVLRRLAARGPRGSRRARHRAGHHVQLVRAVIAKYVPLRIATPLSVKDRKRVVNKFCMIRSCSSGSFDDIDVLMDSSGAE